MYFRTEEIVCILIGLLVYGVLFMWARKVKRGRKTTLFFFAVQLFLYIAFREGWGNSSVPGDGGIGGGLHNAFMVAVQAVAFVLALIVVPIRILHRKKRNNRR